MTQHTLLMETSVLTENHQKNYKKDNFYIISIEIVFIYLSWTFLSQPLSYSMLSQ
ncbi:MAG: hypothetical protein E7J84_03715 [Staphylococcus epidermidis]|nr:hypothetical protein [Staphylococcus epidermidis]